MKLPKIEPSYTFIKTKLPSGKTIGCRGWKVRDEKELIFALDSEENLEEKKINHIIDFLGKCTDNQKLFMELSEQDLKKVACEVRKLSKGNTIEYNYQCPHCNFKMFDTVNLIDSEVVKELDNTPFEVNEDLIVVFKDLSFKETDKLYDLYKESNAKYTFYSFLASIEGITYKGETYTGFTLKDVEEFLGELDSDDLNKLYKAHEEKTSEWSIERQVKCIQCKKEVDISYGDLFSFLVF